MDADQIRNDLLPFCDPATDLGITEGTAGIRIKMVRNGIDQDYFYNHLDGTLVARHVKGGRQIPSIRSLLASSDFADLKTFTLTQNRMYKDFNPDDLIPPDGEIQSERLTQQLLQRALLPQKAPTDIKKIGLVLIDGPAGVGKTSLIKSLLVHRARRQKEASLPPILHVTSRGRRLSGLDDALAQSLDLVRAKFTFDQTPVLIRHNLLQVAIDGFDELVDPEGYKDAWYALRDFFAEVGFGGPIILAGRDTFFDQQSFMKNLEIAPFQSDMTHIRLSAVRPTKAREWLKKQGWSYEDLKNPISRIVFRAGSYALRPFFLSQLVDLKGWKAINASDLTTRAFLVEKYVRREARLLSEQLSISEEHVKERLVSLFEEIALEMADNEADAVDLAFLQLVTEVAFGDLLAAPDLAKLQHKAGSFALLETDAREGYRRFPHTEISHHFLAASLIRMIEKGAYTRFLRRGVVTADLLTIFVEILLKTGEAQLCTLVKNLSKALAEEASFDRLADNSAALLVSSLSSPYSIDLRNYSDLSLLNAVIFGAVEPASLQRIRIQRLDAKEADLTQVEFIDCEVVNLMVDETTIFGPLRPLVHHLLIETADGGVTEIQEPSKIHEWLASHSHGVPTKIENSEALRLLDKVCRVMLRQHMIKEHEQDRAGRLLLSPYWENVEQILTKGGWLERISSKRTSGRSASFLRMRDPYKMLVDHTDAKVKGIWGQVAALPEAH